MKIKKYLSLTLVCAMAFTAGTSALAMKQAEPAGVASSAPFYSDVCMITSAQTRAADLMNTPKLVISSPSTEKISVTASVSAKKTLDKLGFTTLVIEKWNGRSWLPAATWADKYSNNTSSFSWSNSVTGCTSGAHYRATCTFYAKLGTQVQTIDVETSYITCK